MDHIIRCFLAALLLLFIPPTLEAEETREENKSGDKSTKKEVATAESSTSSRYSLGSKREFSSIDKKDFSSFSSDKAETSAGDPSQNELEKRAHALFEKVSESGNFIENLDSGAVVTFPVGITSGQGNNYAILLEKVHWEKDQAYLEAFMSFEIPSSGEKIAFHSDRIPFSMEAGINGEVKMDLVSAHDVDFGDGITLNINSGGETYIKWDCEGFNNMQLSGDVEFSRNVIVPENENGTVKDNEKIKAGFSTNLTDWNNLLVELSMDPFQIKGVNGVGFYVNQAVLDYSDFANPGGINWPDNYLADYNISSTPKLWRGIYIHDADIKLPPEFNGDDTQGRFTITGKEIIIDDRGFTGEVSAQNVFSINQGRMDKWAYSLEEIGIKIKANQLTEANLSGMVNIPALDKNSSLEYSAIMNTGGEYIFSLSPSESVDMSLFAGEMELYETSTIEVEVVDRKFVPTAILNGTANIQPEGKDLELADIEFQQFAISSRAPYMSVGAFSFGSEAAQQTMQGFPLSIQDVGLKEMENQKVGLNFSLLFHLVGESDGAFAAEAGLTVVGQRGEANGIQAWDYKYIHLSDANIDVSTGSVAMSGTLINFEEDNVYGSGFQGNIELEIIGKFSVSAMALFGKTGSLRYWYADALVDLPSGPAIGALEFNQFGGGAFYHMKKLEAGESHNSNIGQTSTGVIYKPDRHTHIGVKARLGFRTVGSEKAFNGDATFEVTFNNSGGIRNIGFRGNGYFVTPEVGSDLTEIQDKFKKVSEGGDDQAGLEKNSSKGQICANVTLDYSVTDKTLHGNLKTYVNIGGGVIEGVGPGGLAGEAVLHFAPDKWYIHIGKPQNPIGIKALQLAQMESYFMVGDEIPAAPDPPSNVSEILGDIDLSYMDDENALETGQGIAFGSSFSVSTGNLKFLMFYGKFAAGMGFDIMLKDYQNVSCKGRTGPIGINGWYANGQAYGYFEGNIGIKVKVFGKKRKKDILDIGAAAIVQAKLPNPTWMKGTVGGRYNILGGLVKGNCRFEVEIGEECDFQSEGSVLEGMETIAEVTPADGKLDINVFNTPQSVFNLKIGEVFEMVDNDDNKQSFKIRLDYFKLQNRGSDIKATKEWNSTGKVVAIKPHELLPGKTQLTVKVQISFLEKENGLWETVKIDGEKVTESREISFTTGERPDFIPRENVLYSYPMHRMYNFYKDEYQRGYIQLDYGQSYLFVSQEDVNWKKELQFVAKNGSNITADYEYNSGEKRIVFDIPSQLEMDKIYKLNIVKTFTGQQDAVDENVGSVQTDIELDSDSTTLTVRTQAAEGEITEEKEKNIYNMDFRTSNYSTFLDKIQSLFISQGYIWTLAPGVYELGVSVMNNENYEMFDKYEINGNQEISPLIQYEAILEDNEYFENEINPLIYSPLQNQDEINITWRNTDEDGVVPKKAFYTYQGEDDVLLSEDEINTGIADGITNEGAFVCNVAHHFAYDYNDLEGKAAVKISNDHYTSWYNDLVESDFPLIEEVPYKFEIKYVLPGESSSNSKKEYSIIYY